LVESAGKNTPDIRQARASFRPLEPAAGARRAVVRHRHGSAGLSVKPTSSAESFRSIAAIAANLCKTPMSIIFLPGLRPELQAHHGAVLPVRSAEPLLLRYASRRFAGPFVISDTQLDPAFACDPLIAGGRPVRFCAGIAVRAPEGTVMGMLAVFDHEPRPEGLEPAAEQALTELAALVQTLLGFDGLVSNQQRLIERQQQLSGQLDHAACHDGLTGLRNRSGFMNAIGLAACRSDMALMLIDVDQLKSVNDRWGYEAGNAVLRHLAAEMRGLGDDSATAARLGGDKLALLLSTGEVGCDPSRVAIKLIKAASKPISFDGREVEYSVCVGYTYGGPGLTKDLFVKQADLALNEAKSSGRGVVRAFQPALERTFRREMSAMQRARQLLDQDRLLPFYQPKVDLRTGRVVGAEALLRWRTDTGGLGSPAEIQAALDDHDLAFAINRRIFEKVLEDIARWREQGVELGHVGINTGTADFAYEDFAEVLIEAMSGRDIPAHMIEIEVTETVILGHKQSEVARALETFRAAGMSVALDDFGTGHAALTNLRTLPITSLKIDRSFVSGLGNPADNAIVSALALIGSEMGLTIVAEGIETEAQFHRLKDMGIAQGQGYYFARPLSFDDLTGRLLSEKNRSWIPLANLIAD
jgi:diguanylate cyclase (GGDEF)-like protein